MNSTPISPDAPDAQPAAPAAAAVGRRCDNCGAQLLGEHCFACGQPTKGLVRHFSSILGDFFDSVFNLDTRTFRTLGPLLVKPGYLSLEYFNGHRVRYVSPVRLFFFLCIAAMFAVSLTMDFDPGANPYRNTDAITSADTVAEVEAARKAALDGLTAARDAIPDTPGARVGMDIAIDTVKDEAERRIEWLNARDAAIRAGTPIPSFDADEEEETDTDATPASAEPDASSTATDDEAKPEKRRRRQVNVGRFQFNDRAWHEKTNPLTLDWLPPRGNEMLNALIGRAQGNMEQIEKKPRLLVEAFFGALPQTLFVLLPLFALLLKIMYLFKRRLYMEHLIVALHSHAFLCGALLVLVGLGVLRDQLVDGFFYGLLGWMEVALGVWMPLYLLIMQKRVYRQGWIMTLIKFCILGTCYLVMLSLGAAVNLAVSLVAM